MKNIQDLLKIKLRREKSGEKKELDEKTLAQVFFEAAKGVVPNLEREDIREMTMKDKTLYIKTAHPVVSSELLLRRDQILKKANQIAEGKPIERILIS